MTGIEICLIIIGIACVCASFFVSRKSASQEVSDSYGSSYTSADVWTEKDEQIVTQRLEEILQEQQEEYVDEAKDRMGQICNEKIMAVDEFSKQILEKINSNHQEVVFMYNMLNEKQKELKTIMAETAKTAAVSQAAPQQTPLGEQQVAAAPQMPASTVSAQNSAQERQPAPTRAPGVTPSSAVRSTNVTNVPEKAGTQSDIDIFAANDALTQTGVLTGLAQVKKASPARKRASGAASAQVGKAAKGKKDISAVRSQPETDISDSEISDTSANTNLQIQKMYKAGKSVLDISKELDIGQGEVKLVIALYEGKKR